MARRSKRTRRGYRSKLQHDKRSIPVRGTGEDRGKYWKCWNCGFICDIDRDELGGPDTRHGAVNTTFVDPSSLTDYPNVDSNSFLILNSGPMNANVLMELGGDGQPLKPYHDRVVSSSGGCPFCGCKNYK